MVFQDFRLIHTKTVFQNVAFAMEIVGSSRKAIQRRVPIVLSIVGLREKALDRPRMLSGGEQQRVAIARQWSTTPCCCWLTNRPAIWIRPIRSDYGAPRADQPQRDDDHHLHA